ncbi:RidA family protein [Streptomyces sp. NPDC051985]|uniref:RidA family protein n=1 Tax=Streptomyces sp. NPDC051985 TaxID=3155807 RepID=UPI00342DA5D7
MEKKLSLPIVPLVRSQDTIYLSGQVGFVEWGKLISGGIEEQTHQTLQNLRNALAQEGATTDDLVKLNVWITDSAEFAAFNRAYAEFFKGGPLPARTTVVSLLAIPGSLVEIDGIAVVGHGAGRG